MATIASKLPVVFWTLGMNIDLNVWLQNKVESKMDEVADDGAIELSHTEKTSAEKRRLLPKEILH